MKKISILIAVAALSTVALAGTAFAQTNTDTKPQPPRPDTRPRVIPATERNAVDGVMGPRATKPEKPGSVAPEAMKGDFKPMPKDPALQKKMMEDAEKIKNLKEKCSVQTTKEAVIECERQIEKMRADRPKTDGERVEDRMENRSDMMRANAEKGAKELRSLHARLTTIADRVESRIKSLTATASNVNTSAAEKHLASARADLATAKTSIDAMIASWQKESATLGTTLQAIKKSEDEKVNKKEDVKAVKESQPLSETRTHMKAAKDALKSAHTHLTEAMKGLGPIVRPTKTTDTQNTSVVPASTQAVQ